MAEFPQDLISQILRLLPVSTLLRFKCVSKSFQRLIDSQNFINFHLNTNFDHSTHRKLVFLNTPSLAPVHVHDFDDMFQPLPNFLLKNPLSDSDSGADEDSEPYSRRLYGHCNGLVLTVEQDRAEIWEHGFGVWNPSTRKYWKLQHTWRRWVKDCSFGYDPCTDDYKVLLVTHVRFYERLEPCDCCFQIYDAIWMVGLRSGCWRKIGDHEPSPLGYCHVSDVCSVDGAFYFVKDEEEIYAVDVFNEKLSLVSLPNDISKETHYVISLQVLEGCICVGFGHFRIRISNDDEGKKETEELYVRKKNDDGEYFWTKLLSFAYEEHFSGRYFGSAIRGRQLGYSKRRDKLFILHVGFGRKLYFYDFEEKSVKRIGEDDIKDCLEVIFYVESLASFDPYLMRKEDDDESTLDISSLGI